MKPIPEKTLGLLTAQIESERTASAAYTKLSFELKSYGYIGFAKWAEKQSQEETEHSQKFIDYLTARGADIGEVKTSTVVGLQAKFEIKDIPFQVFTAAAMLEEKVTEQIKAIYATALGEGDYQTCEFLNWFLAEQTSSEAEINDILNQILIAQGAGTLYALDHEIGEGED